MTNPAVHAGLQLKYQPLWGRIFCATYQGVYYIPQNGTAPPVARDVLSIVEEYPFNSTVREISNNVVREPYGLESNHRPRGRPRPK